MSSTGIAILLHTHMPYVRRNGDWPVGEEWLLEAWAESYMPVWRIIEALTAGALPGSLALTMTPVLAEQLQDGYMEERLDFYLRNKIMHARLEEKRLESMGDEPRRRLAAHFGDFYRGLLADFEDRYRGGMMRVLAEGMDAGAVEVLASAATHAHLPSLGSGASVRAQIGIGLESYRRCFGREPKGFWLPECSYTPDLDEVLADFSPPLSYVVLDFGAAGETPPGSITREPRRLGHTSLVALLRDELAHRLVWTMQGYPSGEDYREFAKRDYDGYGFQYWRISPQGTPLDEKDIYHPARAAARAKRDAEDFISRLIRRADEEAVQEGAGGPSLILAAYDTELMGHWWREGPFWLREVLVLLGERARLPVHVAGGIRPEDLEVLAPRMTAWNVDGTFSTWVNENTAGIWRETHDAESAFLHRIRAHGADARAAAQAARELLLMESSDWTFMIGRDSAAAYARDRFEAHHSRFLTVADMLERGEIDLTALAALEDTDNPFPWLTSRFWR